MSILIKTAEEIEKMRVAGKLAADVLDMISPYVIEGVTTQKLNDLCHDYMVNVQKTIPAPLNYRGFPKSICTSINHQVCHGIPSDKKLKSGDIVNIDITVIKAGYHGDTSRMYCIGQVSPFAKQLVMLTREALFLGIEQIKPGNHFGDIGYAIQKYAHKHRYSIVREFCGHGIGKLFHELPHVMHYGKRGEGEAFQAGMIFTIEPMLNLGKRQTKTLGDGWTVITKDRSLSAQWEHTLLVTETGYEILTLGQDEN
jgi:methionyl aminopeptidase